MAVLSLKRLLTAAIGLLALAAGNAGASAGAGAGAAASAVLPYAQSTAAYKDYMLQCAGCHRFDGKGAPTRGVPSFRESLGLLTRLPSGREYMIRVPGAAQSQLNNAELANVLNWAVASFSSRQVSSDFKPFTANEVGAVRPYRFDDVAPERRRLTTELEALGYQLAPYTFGQN